MISNKPVDKQIRQVSKSSIKNVTKDDNKENSMHGISEPINE